MGESLMDQLTFIIKVIDRIRLGKSLYLDPTAVGVLDALAAQGVELTDKYGAKEISAEQTPLAFAYMLKAAIFDGQPQGMEALFRGSRTAWIEYRQAKLDSQAAEAAILIAEQSELGSVTL